MKKRIALVGVLLVLMLVYNACSSPSTGGGGMIMSDEAPYPQAAGDAPAADTALEVGNAQTQRKVIQKASYYIQVEDFEGSLLALQEKIDASGGYVQSSDRSGLVENGQATCELVIRVPVSNFNGFKQYVAAIGKVLSSTEGGEDVTAQYFDTEARLKVLYAQEERIQGFIEAAETLEELFMIEDELTEIRTEIEQLTTVKTRMDDLVSYATVTLTIMQPTPAKEVVPDEEPFLDRLARTFSNSFNSFVGVAERIVLTLVWWLPYLVVITGVLVILTIVFKSRARRLEQGPDKEKAKNSTKDEEKK